MSYRLDVRRLSGDKGRCSQHVIGTWMLGSSFLKSILQGHEDMAERIADKVRHAMRPSDASVGHFEDEAPSANLSEIDRRFALQAILAALAVGGGQGDVLSTIGRARILGDRVPAQAHVRPDFLRELVAKEYNDRIFDIETLWRNPSAGENALHRSHLFMRSRNYGSLLRNIDLLEECLEHTKDIATRAFFHQRVIIDSNALGDGNRSADHASRLQKLDLAGVDADIRAKMIGRSIDVVGTSMLNTMSSYRFEDFSGFASDYIERSYEMIGIALDSTVEELTSLASEGLNASIYAVIQTKWIRRFQGLDQYKASYRQDAARLHEGWLEELFAVADGLHAHPFAAEIAEDFYYTLCRPAFHAFACDDEASLFKILQLYYEGRPAMRPHLQAARMAVMNRTAPNIQWIRLLTAKAAHHFGREIDGVTYESLKKTLKPSNAVLQRAFLEFGASLSFEYADLINTNIMDPSITVSGIYNQRPYFWMISSQERN